MMSLRPRQAFNQNTVHGVMIFEFHISNWLHVADVILNVAVVFNNNDLFRGNGNGPVWCSTQTVEKTQLFDRQYPGIPECPWR